MEVSRHRQRKVKRTGIRIFRCHDCGHKMWVTSPYCGWCFSPLSRRAAAVRLLMIAVRWLGIAIFGVLLFLVEGL